MASRKQKLEEGSGSGREKRQKPDTPDAMHADLCAKLEGFRAKRSFDAKDWVEKKTAMFNDYMTKAGLKACVVNVSGGIDSALTLALMMHAKKQPGSIIEKVMGIAQPIHSTKSIQNRAYDLCKELGAEVITVDQSDLHTKLYGIVEKEMGMAKDVHNKDAHGFARGQLRSYMRTPVGFYVAQLLSEQGKPCIVLGTGNFDEDGYLLYFCKAGDGVADVQLIADLHKSEVKKAAAQLGVPTSILKAPPSADLWEGQTDEDELGFSYDFVELYTEYLKLSWVEKKLFLLGVSKEAVAQFTLVGEKIERIHRRNKHKETYPLNLNVL